jgi:ankyrin repeat protein
MELHSDAQRHVHERQAVHAMKREALASAAARQAALQSAEQSLVLAALHGDIDLVRQLLIQDEHAPHEQQRVGINVNYKDEESMSALHWASAYNEHRIVSILLRHAAIQVNIANKRNGTPLHQAVLGNAHESIRVLLADARTAIDAVNVWNESALFLAVHNGDKQAIQLLLAAKARTDLLDRWNASVIDVAVAHAESDIARMIRAFDQTGSIEQAAALIPPTLPTTGPSSTTAVEAPPAASLLPPPPPRILSKLMEAPLDEQQFLSWLSKPDININGADCFKWTAVHKLASWNKHACLRALLADTRIVDPMQVGQGGNTPLHNAAEMGATQALQVLLDDAHALAAINAINANCETALHLAASCNDATMMHALLNAQADASIVAGDSGHSVWLRAALHPNADQALSHVLHSALSQEQQQQQQQLLDDMRQQAQRQLQQQRQNARGNRSRLDTSKFSALAKALGGDSSK